MIYVSSPFSHPNEEIRKYRYLMVCRYVANLLENGFRAFSPIAHSEGLTMACPWLTRTFGFWKDLDLDMVRRSDSIHVLKLDGYRQSIGVQSEIAEARNNDIPVSYMEPVHTFTL